MQVLTFTSHGFRALITAYLQQKPRLSSIPDSGYGRGHMSRPESG